MGGGGEGVGTYVPCLNVKNGHFTFWGVRPCPCRHSTYGIFMSFIALSSSLMSYFKVMSLAGILPQQSLFKRCHTHLNIIKTTAGINMISVQAMNLRSPCWCVCTFWIAVWADLQTKITRMMLSSSIAQWSEHPARLVRFGTQIVSLPQSCEMMSAQRSLIMDTSLKPMPLQ